MKLTRMSFWSMLTFTLLFDVIMGAPAGIKEDTSKRVMSVFQKDDVNVPDSQYVRVKRDPAAPAFGPSSRLSKLRECYMQERRGVLTQSCIDFFCRRGMRPSLCEVHE